jgi:hypothetical protein
MKKRYLALSTVAASALVIPMTSGVATATESAKHTPTPTVVVSGLNNPRQLALTRNGELLIAEAGKGGNLATISDPEEGDQGIGRTGAVSVVRHPSHTSNSTPHRLVSGLLSAASPDGSGAVGSDGVSAYYLNRISIQETSFPPDALAAISGPTFNGDLIRATGYGTKTRKVADIAGYEAANNPDGQAIDSDPYAVLQVDDYNLVADAAGNSVLKVDKHGHVSTWHVFPNIVNETCLDPSLQQPPPDLPGCQFVPTSMDTDQWGNVYVGGLGGLVPGQGQVVKLSPNGKRVLKTWTGFTSVTGVAINDVGDLFVSQLFATEAHPFNPAVQGVVTKISHNGSRQDVDVPFPAGIITDSPGHVYVSAFSIAPDTGLVDPSSGQALPGTSGQVWRFNW